MHGASVACLAGDCTSLMHWSWALLAQRGAGGVSQSLGMQPTASLSSKPQCRPSAQVCSCLSLQNCVLLMHLQEQGRANRDGAKFKLTGRRGPPVRR